MGVPDIISWPLYRIFILFIVTLFLHAFISCFISFISFLLFLGTSVGELYLFNYNIEWHSLCSRYWIITASLPGQVTIRAVYRDIISTLSVLIFHQAEGMWSLFINISRKVSNRKIFSSTLNSSTLWLFEIVLALANHKQHKLIDCDHFCNVTQYK